MAEAARPRSAISRSVWPSCQAQATAARKASPQPVVLTTGAWKAGQDAAFMSVVVVHAFTAEGNEHIFQPQGEKCLGGAGQVGIALDLHAGEQAGLGTVGLHGGQPREDFMKPPRLAHGYGIGKEGRGQIGRPGRRWLSGGRVGVHHHQRQRG